MWRPWCRLPGALLLTGRLQVRYVRNTDTSINIERSSCDRTKGDHVIIIIFEPALPCAELVSDGTQCGQPATAALVVPGDGRIWEFLPLCPAHVQPLRDRLNATSHSAGPTPPS